MSKQIFMVTESHPGMSGKLRRAISQADFDAPHLVKIRNVCASLKLKAISPVYDNDKETWAHVGIPSKKVAIYCRSIYDSKRVAQARTDWESLGWKLIFVMSGDVDGLSEEELVPMLADVLKGSKK